VDRECERKTSERERESAREKDVDERVRALARERGRGGGVEIDKGREWVREIVCVCEREMCVRERPCLPATTWDNRVSVQGILVGVAFFLQLCVYMRERERESERAREREGERAGERERKRASERKGEKENERARERVGVTD